MRIASQALPDPCPKQLLYDTLIHNLKTVAQTRDTTLALRVMGGLIRWTPEIDFGVVDEYCVKLNLPMIPVANILDTCDKVRFASVDPRDCQTVCPYFASVVFAPQSKREHVLKRFTLDRDRPEWVRTTAINRTYLKKCGIVLPKPLTSEPGLAWKQDPVLGGVVRLILSQWATFFSTLL